MHKVSRKFNKMVGVTAASCQLTADAGTFALEKGGNAVDALIASQLMAVSCQFPSNNILFNSLFLH